MFSGCSGCSCGACVLWEEVGGVLFGEEVFFWREVVFFFWGGEKASGEGEEEVSLGREDHFHQKPLSSKTTFIKKPPHQKTTSIKKPPSSKKFHQNPHSSETTLFRSLGLFLMKVVFDEFFS